MQRDKATCPLYSLGYRVTHILAISLSFEAQSSESCHLISPPQTHRNFPVEGDPGLPYTAPRGAEVSGSKALIRT